MRRGVSFMAGPPAASPRPGLVTRPTPSPRSSSKPGSSFHETRAVTWAPSVTSGASPASLTTPASAHEAPPAPPAPPRPRPARPGARGGGGGAVGPVGVVAGVLDDDGLGPGAADGAPDVAPL